MVSMGPYNQITDFTHMWDRIDSKPSITYQKPDRPFNNSIYSKINNDKDFTIFLYIVKIAEMDNFLYNLNYKYTVIVPSDRYLKLKKISENFLLNMDKSTAIQICNYCIIKDEIDSNLLQSSPIFYINTYNKISSLLISNNIDKETFVNRNNKIINFNIKCSNGLIHVTDGLLIPYFI